MHNRYNFLIYTTLSGLFFLLFFHSVLGKEYVFIQPWQDQARISAPFVHFTDKCYDSGHLPLWNPYQLAGNPFAANGEAGAFYLPLVLLTLIMDSPQILGWFGWLHMWLGWLAMFALVRDYRYSSVTAVIVATGYVFSGVFVSSAQVTGHYAATIIWIPLMVLILRHASREKRSLHVVFLSFAMFFQVTAGILMYTLPIGLLLLVYSLFFGFRDVTNPYRWRPLTVLVESLFLGVGLAAFQILLNLEMIFNSHRLVETQSRHFTPFSLGLWWEEWGGLERIGYLFYPISTARNYTRHLPTVNFGLLSLWASGIFLLFRGKIKGEAAFWYWISLWYLLLHVQKPLFRFLEKQVPIISSMHIFSADLQFWVLSCCLVAGSILERYFTGKIELSRTAIGITVLALLLAPVTILSSDSVYPASLNMKIFFTFLFTSLVFILIFILFEKAIIPLRYAKVSFLIAVTGFGVLFAYSHLFSGYMRTPRRFFPEPNERVDRIKRTDENNYWRLLPIDTDNLYPNAETLYEFYGVNGYFSMYKGRYYKAVNTTKQENVIAFKRSNKGGRATQSVWFKDLNSPLLDLLGVKHALTVEGELTNDSAFPRCWFSHNFLVLPGDTILERIAEGNFSRDTVLLEEYPLLEEEMTSDSLAGWKFLAYEPNRVLIETSSNSASFFTLSDNYYPGWRALVDGNETKIFESYYLLRTIIVPEGNHKIEFVYEPAIFSVGLIISIATLLLLCLSVVYNGYFRK